MHDSSHLSKESKVQMGGYYTDKRLVDKAYEYIRPYLKNEKNIIVCDSAGGCGAFIIGRDISDYRIADCDKTACEFLEERLDKNKVFHTNSLAGVERKKYDIPNDAFLIMIGNPPYNDTTSEFRSGKKGKNICDSDLFDRDLGISFLKSYDKMSADLVCILHPLSYLIKESNFKRLRGFRLNYRLIRGLIFPSSLFEETGSAKFPIMIGLYEKHASGMDFEHVKNMDFSILDKEKKFRLSRHETADNIIRKYPPRKKDPKISPIGLYYYTFRDLNSLRKNASFMNKPHYNGIVVDIENLYQYAYLYAFKTLFEPDDIWLYGNLSPLVNKEFLENNKKELVAYAVKTNKTLKGLDGKNMEKIMGYYDIDLGKMPSSDELKDYLIKSFKSLIIN